VMCIVYACVKGDGLWQCLMYCTNSICCTADVALAGMNNEEVATKLRGRAGTSVTLKVRRAVSMIKVWSFSSSPSLPSCKLKSRDCLCFLMVPCRMDFWDLKILVSVYGNVLYCNCYNVLASGKRDNGACACGID
jgi:hypothetical protein